jgi:septum formation protein
MKVILASGSPRRKELLGRIFSEFEICPSSADETVPENTPSDKYAEYLAVKKTSDIAGKNTDSLVIGCDTVVISDGSILGKPSDKKSAYHMVKTLSGRKHSVITGICLCLNGKSMSFSCETIVEFYNLSEDEIKKYISTDEPYDKAGAYGIQGAGGLFVKRIEGDFYNVVGLPVAELSRKIKEFTGLF